MAKDKDKGGDTEESQAIVRVKHRSPNYPAMNLERALEKAALLYVSHKRHAVPLPAAMKVMGYKPDSSTGQQAVAALRYYGLGETEGVAGKRQIRVSERAAKIMGQHADTPQLLREAALMPPIHTEIREKFHTEDGLAPDAAIRQYLVFDRPDVKFNEDSVGPFIEQFKQTMAFAGIDSPASMSDDTPEKGSSGGRNVDEHKVKTTPPPGTREFSFPLMDGVAVLRVPHPMGEANFALLEAILKATKAALVGKTDKAE